MKTPPDLSPIFSTAKLINYKKNQTVIHTEDEPQGVYLMVEGKIKAFTANPRGGTYTHLIFSSGELFPLLWTINHSAPIANFQAIVDSTVKRMTWQDFNRAIRQNPAFMEAFLSHIAYLLATYNERLENLQYKYAAERVAYRLLFLVSRFGVKQGRSYKIDLPLPFQEIADAVNLSRKSVSREIQRLVRAGIISVDGRSITIISKDRLAKELKAAKIQH